jgi:hypothetical protein
MKALAIFGAGLLALALALTWLEMTWLALGVLVLVLVVDIVLVAMKADTISRWIHRQFPKAWDMVVMILLLVYTWFVFGATGFVPVLIGVIMGHLFWNE